MTLPTSGTITARQIADTLGYTRGVNGTAIGDYRLNGGQKFVGGTTQQPTEITLPISDGVPVTGPISFSDFYGARPTYVVDYYSGAAEAPSDDARTRFINGTKVIIGSLIGPKDDANDTSGRRVIILVNKDIGSTTRIDTHCALKTGSSWSPDTQLEILVGPHGEILGAGGAGGAGGTGQNTQQANLRGKVGGSGSSALGIQYEGTGRTRVIVQNLGKIAGGGGGGGGGGGARCEREESWSGPERRGDGGVGGSGAGYNQLPTNGAEGTVGAVYGPLARATGGDGGSGGNFGAGGTGGTGGANDGYLEWAAAGVGGAGGAAGAAIRRTNSSIIINVSTQGALSQIAGVVDALGIT